ncbi:MAG: BMP family ABC transporter substrate-binding protein [Succinivibrio sp.]
MVTAHQRARIIAAIALLAATAVAALLYLIVRTGLNGAQPKEAEVFGIVLPGPRDGSGWNKSVFEGFSKAVQGAGGKLVYAQEAGTNVERVNTAVKLLMDRGARTVILAAPGYAQMCNSIISGSPATDFAAFADPVSARNLSSYWVRIYQVSYIAGYTAAAMSSTGVLGYVAASPDPVTLRNVNAYAMGAKAVRTDAVVKVIFTGDLYNRRKAEAAADRLIDSGKAEVLTYMLFNDAVSEVAKRRRVKYIGFLEDPNKYDRGLMLGMINVNWQRFADLIIKDRLAQVKSHMVRWYGLDDDIVWFDNRCNYLTTSVLNHIQVFEASFAAGHEVFSGDIKDSEGNYRCRSGEVLSDETLSKSVLWLVRGIEKMDLD